MMFPFEILAGVTAGLLCKSYFANQMKSKIEEHQADIILKEQRIIELEALNEDLSKRLKDMEVCFSKDHIIMN